MSSFDYSAIAAEVLELIADAGMPCLLEGELPTFTPGTGATSGTLPTCSGSLFAESFATDDKVRAATVYLAASGLTFAPRRGFGLYLAATADATQRWVIEKLETVKPAGTAVLYILELSR